MLRLIGGKLVRLVPVLFLVSLATFFLLELVPGDPAATYLGPNATPEQYEIVRTELGLDEPVADRYLDWLGAALQGDLGKSLVPPVQEVSALIGSRLPVTIEITVLAIGMSLLVSIPMALLAAYRVNGRFDRATRSTTFAAISVPSFLAGLLLVFVMIFNTGLIRWPLLIGGGVMGLWLAWRAMRIRAVMPSGTDRTRQVAVGLGSALTVIATAYLLWSHFPDFPRTGFVRWSEGAITENLKSAFLPALTLAIGETAIFSQLLRSDLITTLREDYILSAKAKGMPARRVLVQDALRPSSFSLITIAGLTLGRLLGGTAIVETIFGVPGMGTLVVSSVSANDYPVVQGAVLVLAVFFVLINMLIEVVYAYLDPRIRRGRR